MSLNTPQPVQTWAAKRELCRVRRRCGRVFFALKIAGNCTNRVNVCVCRTKTGNLSPVSPVKNRLSPVVLGTDLFNGDNDLQAFLPFVPSVPSFFEHGWEQFLNLARQIQVKRFTFCLKLHTYPPPPVGSLWSKTNADRSYVEKALAAIFGNRFISFYQLSRKGSLFNGGSSCSRKSLLSF